MTDAERAVPSTGGPFGDRAAVAIVGDSLGDVAREALKIARVESQSRPVLLVDLLGEGSALGELFADDDPHGVSDAARYGVSLNRVARQVPNADSLFVVPGGAESPLADDVLSDHLWSSWSDQCRRAGALLVVAAPADLPAVERAIDQLDAMVVIGDATVPTTHVPVIGRVPASRRAAVAGAPGDAVADTPSATPAVNEDPPASADDEQSFWKRLILGAFIGLVIAGAAGGLVWMNGMVSGRDDRGERPVASAQPIVMPGDPTVIPAAGDVAVPPAGAARWAVEIASVNSFAGAMSRVRRALDSLPVPTFAAIQRGGGATWYRLLAGAFASSGEADSLLGVLRDRGAIEPAAGRVVQAPFAWLLEENVLDDQLPVRLFLWRQQGLPAYALLNTQNGTSRIYFGAFENEAEARLLTPVLDSLNLYATLATRIGSVR